MRRVVVTGLGAITPLGVGARRSWRRLLAGESGLTDISIREPAAQWQGLTSTVAGVVPSGKAGKLAGLWHAPDWLDAAEQRRMPTFAQYAMAAAEMALADAGWKPTGQSDLEATGVCLGSGIGNLEELYKTTLAFEKDVSTASRVRLAVGSKAKFKGRATKRCLLCSFPKSSSIWLLVIFPSSMASKGPTIPQPRLAQQAPIQ